MRKKILSFLVKLTIVVCSGYLTATFYQTGYLDRWTPVAYDQFLSFRTEKFTNPRIILVNVSDADMRSQNQWNWSWGLYARLLDALSMFRARSVAFNMVLDHAPNSLGEDELVQSIRKSGNVFLAVDRDEMYVVQDGSIRASTNRLRLAAKGEGHIALDPDSDGFIRSVNLRLPADRPYMHLGLKLALDLYGVSDHDVRFEKELVKFTSAQGQMVEAPLMPHGKFPINWAGRWGKTFLHVTFGEIIKAYEDSISGMKPDLPIEVFKNSICLVNITVPALGRRVDTPVERAYPSAGVTASVLNSFIEQEFLTVLRETYMKILMAILSFCMLFIFLVRQSLPRFLLTLVIWGLYLCGSFFSLVLYDLWLDVLYPTFLIWCVYLVGSLYYLVSTSFENRRLMWLATKDQRTGLVNRGHFKILLRSEIQNVNNRRRQHVSLAMIDVDRFKDINDQFGHSLGDEILKFVAHQIKETVRSMDVACRYGGEEFVIMLPGTGLSDGKIVAEKVRSNIEKKIHLLGAERKEHRITASIGVAEYRKSESIDQLIERADKALYQAKCSGRNRVEIASS